MSRIAKHSRRSDITRSAAERSGPNGFHHNPQDFSERAGASIGSRQEFLRKHWDYLPPHLRAKADGLSTTFRGVPIDQASGQFALCLG